MKSRDNRNGVLRVSNELIRQVVDSECKIAMKQKMSNHDLTNHDLRVYMTLLELSTQHSNHDRVVKDLVKLGFRREALNGRKFPLVFVYHDDCDDVMMKRVYGDKWKRVGKEESAESIRKLVSHKYVSRSDDGLLIPVYTDYTEIAIDSFRSVSNYYLFDKKSHTNTVDYIVLMMCCVFKQMSVNDSTKCYLTNTCELGTEQMLFARKRRIWQECQDGLLKAGLDRKFSTKKVGKKYATNAEFSILEERVPTFDEVKLSEADEDMFWMKNVTCDTNTESGKMKYARHKLKCLLRDDVQFSDKQEIQTMLSEYDQRVEASRVEFSREEFMNEFLNDY